MVFGFFLVCLLFCDKGKGLLGLQDKDCREAEAGPEAETMKRCCLLALPDSRLTAFLIQTWPISPGRTLPKTGPSGIY